ncbi:Smr/MutS family protein [Neotamlana laminarinivorans]|uniref:DNA mismatch repair protein MutS n=1 Tax=Neotamlana laminarinivorans TaxID=2883124 RepID=A0A9X1L2N8_9FLAO|nr:Smr/MutS family protein [Tamlana laminarinivorans]MCB4797382.1 DNA mismatch repair protein MutS [Tamlana laminarinivorans]
MSFKLGDLVLVLDEDLQGTVKKIIGQTITIETDDGFLIDFDASDLIKQKNDFSKQSLTSNFNLAEKEEKKRKASPVKKGKAKFEPTMEVDLHIHQLVPSTRGMTNHDMLTLQLDTARRKLDFAIAKRIQKIVFIHGVGEGVLKLELEYLFGRYDNIKYYDANYQKYGLGATEVYIFQNVN